MNTLVKIHGNYCGPNWTGGKPLAANSPKVDWTVKPVDQLDNACRIHDLSCSKDGCSAADDRRLARKAAFIALINPVLAPMARAVSIGMFAASITRRR